MMKRRRKVTLQYTLTTICFTTLLLAHSSQSGFVFRAGTGECPSNPELRGYTSVEDLNADIQTEFLRITTDGGSQQDSYFLLLCPDTTFSTEDVELMPKLNKATFSCGESGDVNQNCIFSGGEENVRVRNPGIEGFVFDTMSFVGITFQEFTDQSISLRGAAPTETVFIDCVWRLFDAGSIVRIRNTQGLTPMSFKIEKGSIKSVNGDGTDAKLGTAFRNEGGTILVDSLVVENVNVETMFRIQSNGVAIIKNSNFTNSNINRLTQTTVGMTDLDSVHVSGNAQVQELFVVDGEGSSTTFSQVTVDSNAGDNPFGILRVVNGGTAELRESTIENNGLLEYAVLALTEEGSSPQTTISILDTDFISNTGIGGGGDKGFVHSQGDGAFIDMTRNEFIENTDGLANIAAFFGGGIRFVQTCFSRNNNMLVAIVLEFSEFEASDNYVEDESSIVCDGLDALQGLGRLSEEVPGSNCFKEGGENCSVNCLTNANDIETCTASLNSAPPSMVPSISQQPSVSSRPSQQPSVSCKPSFITPQPTESLQPSLSSKPSLGETMAPTISHEPSVSLQPSVSHEPSVSHHPSISTVPSVSLEPSVSSMPTISSMPTNALPPSDKLQIFRPPLRRPHDPFFFGKQMGKGDGKLMKKSGKKRGGRGKGKGGKFNGVKNIKKYGKKSKKFTKKFSKKGGKKGIKKTSKKSKKWKGEGKGGSNKSDSQEHHFGIGFGSSKSDSNDYHFGIGYMQPRSERKIVTKWHGKRFGEMQNEDEL